MTYIMTNTYKEFEVKPGTTQGCFISPFLLANDWKMKELTIENWKKDMLSRGINLMNQHDDLGFVDNLDLFSNPYD